MAIKASALVLALLFVVAASAQVLAPAPAPVPSPSAASAPLTARLPSWEPGVKYSPITIATGGTVSFAWEGAHGVSEVPSSSCPSSFTAAGVTAVAPVANSGSYDFKPTKAGTYWFACPVTGHCSLGQIVEITVV